MNADKEGDGLNKSGYLLDTDVLIGYLRGKNAKLKKRMNELLRREIPVYMSIISLGELYLGAFKSDNTPKNLSLVDSLKERLELLVLSEDSVKLYGEIEAVLERRGQVIGDLMFLLPVQQLVMISHLSQGMRGISSVLLPYSGNYNSKSGI